MANTMTNIIPFIVQGLDTVQSEPCGLIQRVSRDINGDKVALNQVVRSPISAAMTPSSSAPSAYGPTASQTLTYADVTISKDQSCVFSWSGDEELSLGSTYAKVLSDNFAQAFRGLRNAVEADLAALYASAGLTQLGTALTTPFGTDLSAIATAREELVKAGADTTNFMFVVDPSAYANMITKTTLISNANANVNSADVLSNAKLPKIYNFDIGESAGIHFNATTGTDNMFFHKSAIQLVARAPKSPSAGDMASDTTTMTDAASGLVFTISAYPQHRQISFEVGLAWGCAVTKAAWLGVFKG